MNYSHNVKKSPFQAVLINRAVSFILIHTLKYGKNPVRRFGACCGHKDKSRSAAYAFGIFGVKIFFIGFGEEKKSLLRQDHKSDCRMIFFMGIGYEAAGHAQTVRFFFRLGKQRENGGFSLITQNLNMGGRYPFAEPGAERFDASFFAGETRRRPFGLAFGVFYWHLGKFRRGEDFLQKSGAEAGDIFFYPFNDDNICAYSDYHIVLYPIIFRSCLRSGVFERLSGNRAETSY